MSRGKHLLTRIGADHTLHTHLKMEGSWHLYRPGHRVAPPRPRGARGAAHGGVDRGRLRPRRRRGGRPRRRGHRRRATSAPTCSARTGTRTRRCAGCGPTPSRPVGRRDPRPAQPGRHRQPVQERAVLPRRACTRGCRSARSPDLPRLVRRARAALEANKTGSSRPSPATPAGAGRPGSTAATGSRAGAAAPASGSTCRARGPGAGDVLVPVLPAGARLSGPKQVRRRRRPRRRCGTGLGAGRAGRWCRRGRSRAASRARPPRGRRHR